MRNSGFKNIFGNSVTFHEIEYAAPLAVNGIVRCDLGFCPKLERKYPD
jgi:hypothetical protein